MEANDNIGGYFVSPISVSLWEQSLSFVLLEQSHLESIRHNVIKNVAHRFQYLEFISSLLICDWERRRDNPRNSSLHDTVKVMNGHTYTVVVNSIVEGIGSYLYRISKSGYDVDKKVSCGSWIKAITEKCYPDDRSKKRDLRKRLEAIKDYRDDVHLDSFQKGERIQYHTYTDDLFIEIHNTFVEVLKQLHFSQNSCLLEELQ
jgi:hypothetical protein